MRLHYFTSPSPALSGVGGGGSASTVTDISRDASSAAGGTEVTIAGTGFSGVPSVTFGGTSATGVVVDSATSLRCTVPAHTVGVVDVEVAGVGLVNPRATIVGGDFQYLPTATTTFVNADFETGSIPASLTAVAGTGTVAASSTRAYRGTYSVRCARSTTGSSYVRNTTNLDVASEANGVYVRYYLYMDATTLSNLGDQIKIHLFRRQAGDGQPGWLMTGIGTDFPDGSGAGDTFVTFIDNGILNIGSPNQGRSAVGVGSWVEFIWWSYWNAGASQGQARMWVNGKQLFDTQHASLGSANVDYRLQMGIAYCQNPVGSCEVFMDEVKIANGFPEPVVP